MRKKGLLILGIIVLVFIIGFIYLLSANTTQYKNITVNGAILEVPESNITVVNQSEYYSIYNENQHGVSVYVFDNVTDVNSSDLKGYTSILETNQAGSLEQNNGNYSYNYSETLKQYTYLTNYTTHNYESFFQNKLREISTGNRLKGLSIE